MDSTKIQLNESQEREKDLKERLADSQLRIDKSAEKIHKLIMELEELRSFFLQIFNRLAIIIYIGNFLAKKAYVKITNWN